MHLNRRKISIPIMAIALVVLVSPIANATSIYSLNLLGERIESGDVRAITLGGSTQLVIDSLAVNHRNPAMLAHLTKVTIGASQFVGLDEGRSNDYTEKDISALFSSLIMAFPFHQNVVLSVGYRGRYDPDGSFTEREMSPSGEAFNSTFTRNGGLFSIPFSLSVDVTRFLSLGGTISLERGFVEERYDIQFDDPLFEPSSGIQKESVSGTGFGGGAVLYPFEGLAVGGMFESSIDYDTEVQQRFTQSNLDTFFTRTAKLPSRFEVGASWHVIDPLLLLVSGSWSDFTDYDGFGFDKSRLSTEQTLAVGVEYLRGLPIGGGRLPIRGSFSYEKLPYDHPANTPGKEPQAVNRYQFGLGTGISLGQGKGKLDIGFIIGKTGSLTKNLVEDRLFRIFIGISGGETWKRKGAERDR